MPGMGWIDKVLDADEGSVEKTRTAAAAILIMTWLVIGLFALAVLATAVLGLAGVVDLESPWDSMFPIVVLMLVMQLAAIERYRRRRLEHRLAALEAATSDRQRHVE